MCSWMFEMGGFQDSRIPGFQDSRWVQVATGSSPKTGGNWWKLVEPGWNWLKLPLHSFLDKLLIMLFGSINSLNFICKVMNDLKNHAWYWYNYIINSETLNLLPRTKWIRFSLFRSLIQGSRWQNGRLIMFNFVDV